MKKALFFSSTIIALTAFSSISPPDTIVGRWQQKVKGITWLFLFRADNTVDLFFNGKLFTSGKYAIRQDTIALADPGCSLSYYGTYKLDFFAADSVRFTAIADTCKARNGAMHKFTAGRRSADAGKAVKP